MAKLHLPKIAHKRLKQHDGRPHGELWWRVLEIILRVQAAGGQVSGLSAIPPWWLTHHHLHARCRCHPIRQAYQYQRNSKTNTIPITREVHDAWHNIWKNMSPPEVLACLVGHIAPRGEFTVLEFDYLWDNLLTRVRGVDAARRFDTLHGEITRRDWLLVFPECSSWFEVAEAIVMQWSPKGEEGFTYIRFVDRYGATYSRTPGRRR